MGKKLRVSFFSVDMQNNTHELSTLLNHLMQMTYKERIIEDSDIMLDEISLDSHTNLWYGVLTKVRMGMLPEKYDKKTGKHGELELDDDEGIAEMTAFLYDPYKKILLIQRSQYGPMISGMADYLQSRFSALPISITPVLNQDALAQFGKFEGIKNFVVKFAKMQPDAVADNSSITSLLNTLNPLGYGNVVLTVRADRNRNLTDRARSLVKGLLNYKEIEKLEVKGDTGDPIDLLKWKLEDKHELRHSTRTLTFAIRKNALYTIYNKHKKYLYDILA